MDTILRMFLVYFVSVYFHIQINKQKWQKYHKKEDVEHNKCLCFVAFYHRHIQKTMSSLYYLHGNHCYLLVIILFYALNAYETNISSSLLYCCYKVENERKKKEEKKFALTKIIFIILSSLLTFIEFFISCHIWPFRHSEANSFLFFHIFHFVYE